MVGLLVPSLARFEAMPRDCADDGAHLLENFNSLMNG